MEIYLVHFHQPLSLLGYQMNSQTSMRSLFGNPPPQMIWECTPFLIEFGDNLTFWSCICEYGWYWNGNSSCCSGCELRWVCSASAMVCSDSWPATTASFSGVVFEVSWGGKCSLSSEGTSRLGTSSWSVVTSTEIALFLTRWLLLVTSSSTGMLTGLCVSCWYT